MMEDLKIYIFNIAYVIELISFAIMIYGSIFAILHLLGSELKRVTKKFNITTIDIIRHDFGYYILLGLEFLIAADIIQTILKPTSEELIELGGIVVIRILLSFFLNKEIKELKEVKSSYEKTLEQG
jgi:uncharacterized membrane protein